MIDPVSLHVVVQACHGLQKAVTHVLSVGSDRVISKGKLLELASKALSEMTELRLDLGDDLCIEDRDKYRRFVEEYQKDVAKLKRKKFWGKTAAERLSLEVENEHSELTSKSKNIKKARDAAQGSGRSSPQSAAQPTTAMQDNVVGAGAALPVNASFNVQAQVITFNNCSFDSRPGSRADRSPSREGSKTPSRVDSQDYASQLERLENMIAETRDIRRQMESSCTVGVSNAPAASDPSGERGRALATSQAEELLARLNHNTADIISLATEVTKDLGSDSGAASPVSEDGSDVDGSLCLDDAATSWDDL